MTPHTHDPDGVPNLDAMNNEELLTFYRTQQDGMAWRELFEADESDWQLVQETARQLSLYAWDLYVARLARFDGKMPEAQRYEALAQRTYERLPEWARW